MFLDQLAGTGIHSASGRKNGWVRIRQPMAKSLRSPAATRLYLAMRARTSCAEAAPLASRNASHASEHGKEFECVKTPPPTMALCGARSLKRKSSPGLSALNVESEGAQKLTSLMFGTRRNILNQSSSVTATMRLMLNSDRPADHRACVSCHPQPPMLHQMFSLILRIGLAISRRPPGRRWGFGGPCQGGRGSRTHCPAAPKPPPLTPKTPADGPASRASAAGAGGARRA